MVPTTRRRLKRSSIAPSWSCGTILAARHSSGHSVPSGRLGTLLNILPGAAAGAAETSNRSLIGDRRRSRAKIPRIKIFRVSAGDAGAGPFYPESEVEPESSGH